jgi:hypothetical protein
LFADSLEDLENLKTAGERNEDVFYRWVVGLDLCGDEMGYPYCPFVAWPFLEYVNKRREKNKNFGLRFHYGENVVFADINSGVYRHFIAHMYIGFICLRFLKDKLKYGIRIGHGIAFARILDEDMKSLVHRKSSILLAEMKEHYKHVLENIVFEVNITSNKYLLGPALRRPNLNQPIKLDKLRDFIILATDNDGVWPIDNCRSKHKGHQSVAAEYCQAISSSLISSSEELKKMLERTNNCRFHRLNNHNRPMLKEKEEIVDTFTSAIILHPDLIKTILIRHYNTNFEKSHFFKQYNRLYPRDSCTLSNEDDRSWKDKCNQFASLAFVAHENLPDPTQIQDYFEILFPDNKEDFEQISNACYNLRTQFMSSNDVTKSYHCIHDSNYMFLSQSSHNKHQQLCELVQCVTNKCSNTNDTKVDVFVWQTSVPCTSTDSFLDKVIMKLDKIPQYVKHTCASRNNCHVFVFQPSASCTSEDSSLEKRTMKLDEFSGYVKDICASQNDIDIFFLQASPLWTSEDSFPENIAVKMFTTKNKDQYIDSKNERLTINNNPSERTNYLDYNMPQQQHLLYVVCRHASAATAYLHYIGNKLGLEKRQQDSNSRILQCTNNNDSAEEHDTIFDSPPDQLTGNN